MWPKAQIAPELEHFEASEDGALSRCGGDRYYVKYTKYRQEIAARRKTRNTRIGLKSLAQRSKFIVWLSNIGEHFINYPIVR